MAEDAPDGSGPLPKPAYTNVTSELTTDDEAFKHRPPYLTLKPDEFGPVTWRGRCHCGNIRYSLRREMPLNAKYCHCRGCQVMHGAPFQWAAIFHKSDMTFANGSCGLEFYSSLNQSSEYGTPTKVSCCHCRTPIMDEGRRVCLLFPTLIDLSGWDNETMERRKAFEARSRGSYLITDHILGELPEIKNYKVGLLTLFVQHTSCALSLNENWDEDVRDDMSDALDRIVPVDRKGTLYRHSAEGEDDMPAHVKSALIGASVTIPISNGRLATGTWQGIWFLEFRTSRHSRRVVATIQGEKA
ncbi:hypothetical protein MPDQ_007517 [Monascus purpureus]|uniref:CENP-V/GFA domain-containing protein n=1 Tax=Monascus purpureus TaxID=5098 RepID=A0A507R1X8_MONPU|nr:hypothetical protein MPDQ_007517 [Monascus purpureus]